jgi:hypothetical protein
LDPNRKGEYMQFVVLKEIIEPDYSLERKIIEVESKNACIRRCLKRIDLSKKLIATYNHNEQIRIPENVFKNIDPEVQKALREISIKPEPTPDADERWVKENYWAYCRAYIFNFEGIELSVGVQWGYEGEDEHEYSFFITEMKHPFVGEFLGCSEGANWGKFAEEKNIEKWLKKP